MRPIPVLTALVVMTALYFIVMEREALLAYARGDEVEAVDAEMTEAALADAPAMSVVAYRSTAQTIDSAVVLRGQTEALRHVDVRSETSSIVISEPLRRGAFVNTGDILCQLDHGARDAALAEAQARLLEAQSRVPEAEARLLEAKARLAEANINNNAAEKLIDGGYASQTRLIATRATVSSAEAQIASAESGLEATKSGIEAAHAAVVAAERDIKHLTIRAPFEGLLETDAAELGSLMQPGSLCATVIQLDPIKVVGYVPETEVDRVVVGSTARAQLASGLVVEGRVTFLSRSADPETRTFRVDVTVPNPELLIRDGQTATISIASEGAKAHRLPQSALTLNNEGQLGVRIVSPGNIVAFQPVTLVRDDNDGVWVTGLPEVADVIIVGQEFVTAGVLVAPTYQEPLQ